MAEPEVKMKSGVTPGKLALIAGLAVLLVIVIVVQLRPSGPTAPGEKITPRPQPRGGRNAATASAANAAAAATTKKAAWPILARDEVQQHNPFHISVLLAPTTNRAEADPATADVDATRQSEDDDAAREREELLAELRGDGVNLIVLSEDGQVAKIGGKRIRVGDIIRGFRVVQIAADGIELVEHKTE